METFVKSRRLLSNQGVKWIRWEGLWCQSSNGGVCCEWEFSFIKRRCKKGIGYTQLARFGFQTVCTLRPHLGMDSDSEEANSSCVEQICVSSHVMEMCFFIWRQKIDAIDKNSVSFVKRRCIVK
jgi:hypothetical protein